MTEASPLRSQEPCFIVDEPAREDLATLIERLNRSLRLGCSIRCRASDSGVLELVIEEASRGGRILLAACRIEPRTGAFSGYISPGELSRAFSDLAMASGLGLSIFKPSPDRRHGLRPAK